MRLAEVAGLLKSDIILDEDIPFIRLQPHSWRNLKTSGSERDVPLVGMSLWAAQRLLEAYLDSVYAFPRYNKTTTTNANLWASRPVHFRSQTAHLSLFISSNISPLDLQAGIKLRYLA